MIGTDNVDTWSATVMGNRAKLFYNAYARVMEQARQRRRQGEPVMEEAASQPVRLTSC